MLVFEGRNPADDVILKRKRPRLQSEAKETTATPTDQADEADDDDDEKREKHFIARVSRKDIFSTPVRPKIVDSSTLRDKITIFVSQSVILPVNANESSLYLDGFQRRMEAGWTSRMDQPDGNGPDVGWTDEPGGRIESITEGTKCVNKLANGGRIERWTRMTIGQRMDGWIEGSDG